MLVQPTPLEKVDGRGRQENDCLHILSRLMEVKNHLKGSKHTMQMELRYHWSKRKDDKSLLESAIEDADTARAREVAEAAAYRTRVIDTLEWLHKTMSWELPSNPEHFHEPN